MEPLETRLLLSVVCSTDDESRSDSLAPTEPQHALVEPFEPTHATTPSNSDALAAPEEASAGVAHDDFFEAYDSEDAALTAQPPAEQQLLATAADAMVDELHDSDNGAIELAATPAAAPVPVAELTTNDEVATTPPSPPYQGGARGGVAAYHFADLQEINVPAARMNEPADEASAHGAADSDTTHADDVYEDSPARGPPLAQQDLVSIAQAAIERWSATALGSNLLAQLQNVQFQIVDLPGSALGRADGSTISIDPTAAGYGWFVDPTPADNSEFNRSADGQWIASANRPSYGHVDLFTIVSHELGHVLGLEDANTLVHPSDLMAGELAVGQRRLIDDTTLAQATQHPFASLAQVYSHASGSDTLNGLIDSILATFGGAPPSEQKVFHSGDDIPGTGEMVPAAVQVGHVPAALGSGSDLQLENLTLTFPTNLTFDSTDGTWSGGVGITATLGVLFPGILDIGIIDDAFDAPRRVKSAEINGIQSDGKYQVVFTLAGDHRDIDSSVFVGNEVAVINSSPPTFNDADLADDSKQILITAVSFDETNSQTAVTVEYNFDPGTSWNGGSLLALPDPDIDDDGDSVGVSGTIQLSPGNPNSILAFDTLEAADIGFPRWLDIRIEQLQMEFPDFRDNDANNMLRLDAALNGFETGNFFLNDAIRNNPLLNLNVTGQVTGIEFNMDKLAEGSVVAGRVTLPKNPITDISGISGEISGTLFGVGSVQAGFIVKEVAVDENGAITTQESAIVRTVLYGAVRGSLSFAGTQVDDGNGKTTTKGAFGVGLNFAVSELGPLQLFVFSNVLIPIEPVSGLVISELRGGVRFNSTIEDLQVRPPIGTVAGAGTVTPFTDPLDPQDTDYEITLTTTGHNLKVGDEFRIIAAGNPAYLSGAENFVVKAVNGDDITYDVEDDPGAFTTADIRKITISDPLDLRDPGFASTKDLSLSEWQAQLDQAVVNQTNAGDSVWDVLFDNVVIEAGATLSFTPRISDKIVSFDADLLFDSEGRFLISGTMNLLLGTIKLPTKLYADFSDVTEGAVRFLGLIDLPAVPQNTFGVEPLIVVESALTFETLVGGVPATLDAATGFPSGVGINVTAASVTDLSGTGVGPWDVTYTLDLPGSEPSDLFSVGDSVIVVNTDPGTFNGTHVVRSIDDANDQITVRIGTEVIDGLLDVDLDHDTDANDDGVWNGIPVIGGALDMNRDGTIDAEDNGEVFTVIAGEVVGWSVVEGKVDVDGDGVVVSDADDDGVLGEDPGTYVSGGALANSDALGDGLRISIDGAIHLNIPFVTTLSLEGTATFDFTLPGPAAAEDARFDFGFDVVLSETHVGSIAQANGALHATIDVDQFDDVGGVPLPHVEIWGAALLTTNFDFLAPFGLFASAEAVLRLNTASAAKPAELLQKADGSTVAVELPAQSVAVRLAGSLDFRIDFNANGSFEPSEQVLLIEGIGVFEFSAAQGFNVALFREDPASPTGIGPATLEIGPAASPFLEFDAFAFVAIRKDDDLSDGVDNSGFAASIAVALNVQLGGVIEVDAQAVLVMNTTGQQIDFVIPVGADERTGTDALTVSIPRGPPGDIAAIDFDKLLSGDATAFGASVAAAPYLLVFFGGTDPTSDPDAIFRVGGFVLQGRFSLLARFDTSFFVEIQADATLDVTVGSVNLLRFDADGFLRIDSGGVLGVIDLNLNAGIPGSFGFTLTANFRLELNATGSVQSLAGFGNIDPGFRIHADGLLKLAGDTFVLDGTFDLEINSSAASLRIHAGLSVFGFPFTADGLAIIQGGSHPGIVFSIVLTVGGSNSTEIAVIPGKVNIKGQFLLQINTTGVTVGGIAPGLRIAVSGPGGTGLAEVNVIGFKMAGSLAINISSAGLSIDNFSASLNFFGLFDLNVHGFIRPDAFSLTASASIHFNFAGIFSLSGSVFLQFQSFDPLFTGRISGRVSVFGFSASVSAGIQIRSTSVTVFFRFSVTLIPPIRICLPFIGCFTIPALRITINAGPFTLGHITPPAPVVPNEPPPEVEEPTPPPDPILARVENGVLLLNIGVDAHLRDPDDENPVDGTLADPVIDEAFTITHVGGSAGNETVAVSAFGFTQEYTGVAEIRAADAGDGNDFIRIETGVLSPAELNGGGDHDDLSYFGRGDAVINGNAGNDSLRGGSGSNTMHGGPGNDGLEAGSGQNFLFGDEDDDTFAWNIAAGGQLNTVDGGDGSDTLRILGTDAAEVIQVTRAGTNFEVDFAGLLAATTGVEGLILDARGGADAITINDLTGSVLGQINVLLGEDDGAADSVTFHGSPGGDAYDLSILQNTLVGARIVNGALDITDRTLASGAQVKSGRVDVNGDDKVDEEDDDPEGTLLGIPLIDGLLDVNNNGEIDPEDDGLIEDANGVLLDLGDFVSLKNSIAVGIQQGDAATGDSLTIKGDGGADDLDAHLVDQHRLNMTFEVSNEAVQVVGSQFDDAINVDVIGDSPSGPLLDGQGGSDTYDIRLSGSADTTIMLSDSGNAADNDIGFVHGTQQADVFALSDTALTLGASTEEIQYAGLERLTIDASGGPDTVVLTNLDTATLDQVILQLGDGDAQADSVVLEGSPGADVFDLSSDAQAVSVTNAVNVRIEQANASDVDALTINGNGGADAIDAEAVDDHLLDMTFNVTGDAVSLVGSQFADIINVTVVTVVPLTTGDLMVDGQGGGDTLNIDDTGDTMPNVGTLTATTLTGLGLGAGGIDYYAIETLNVNLGSGSDVFNVRGTSAETKLALNAGDDKIFVSSVANETLASAETADFLHGNLDAIAGALNIDAGTGRHRLMVSDESAAVGDVAELTNGSISGLAPAEITYTTDDPAGNFADGITVWAGSAADTIDVISTHRRTGLRTITTLNTGDGSDDVTVALDAATDGFFVLNTQKGDDTVRGRDSTLPLIVFGGDDGDNITGGTSDDILFGDRGRVEYYDAFDVLVARLGGGGPGDLTDGVVRPLGKIYTVDPQSGGDDVIDAGDGSDLVLAGNGDTDDVIDAGDGDNVVLGDHGRLVFDAGMLQLIESTDPAEGDADTIATGTGNDIVIGGTGGDTIDAGSGNDLVIGDHGSVAAASGASVDADALPLSASNPFTFTSMFTGNMDEAGYALGGGDMIYGQAGQDILVGGQGGDTIYGGDDDDDIIGGHNVAGGADSGDALDGGDGADVIVGDNGSVSRRGDAISLRFRVLAGQVIYDSHGLANVTADPQANPAGSEARNIALFDDPTGGAVGNDNIAGGSDDDVIFGQRGNDAIQGDGSIDLAVVETLTSVESVGDGDDYIEGGGGDDLILGNGGQDDLIGGSSDLFGLNTPDARPDGGDVIFGGAGARSAINDPGDTSPEGHANDADAIAGDNANIFRLVGTGGASGGPFLSFIYDDYTGSGGLKIIPRAVQLLDYTPGGMDFDASAANDLGAGDVIHGEAGDDTVYGQTGNDVLYGDGQDDDLIGGYGHDWFSGGTGIDGILGDDGRVYTSRNTLAPKNGEGEELISEPLYGIAKLDEVDEEIATPAQIQYAMINHDGALKKTANIEPFGDPLFEPVLTDSDDVVYGGLGDDFLHGGYGDDALSGAEALPEFYNNPQSPGNVLGFDPVQQQFAFFDEFDPLRKIDGFLLNFEAFDVAGAKVDDGNDVVFGDRGNDWLVGGTQNDHLYGGFGDDLLDADDNHDTTAASADPLANDVADVDPYADADLAFGGGGRDVFIANTRDDRLVDWMGQFNAYIVPFNQQGAFTISRTVQPHLFEFLYALSAGDGADPTRAADTGADPTRNGEPEGELGLVEHKDPQWHDQTGAPLDVLPGTIPAGARDVIAAANFNDGAAEGFAPDSGIWQVATGRFEVAPTVIGQDAASVFYVDYALPAYFELLATINAGKPTSGSKSNAFLMFDYQGPSDFKFAGVNISTNKLQMGRRTTEGWIVDVQTPAQLKPDTDYSMLLALNGTVATLVVNNTEVFSHTFAARVDADGFSYGLNAGMVGIGADNSTARIDNVQVQVLPPEITLEQTEDFTDGVADPFSGPVAGDWQITAGSRYEGTPSIGGDRAITIVDLSVAPAYLLRLEATLSTETTGGFVFDLYTHSDFKFVALSAATGEVLIGHHTTRDGWSIDAAADAALTPGADYDLGVILQGTTVSVTLAGQVVTGHAFNALVTDGAFGLLTRVGASSFDTVTVKTNDPALAGGENLLAGKAASSSTMQSPLLHEQQLQPVFEEALRRWSIAAAQSALSAVTATIVDLPGLVLGRTAGNRILIDSNAAGYGWFVDVTPQDDDEFGATTEAGVPAAADSSAAFGRMDLLTVVMHEIGHVLGLGHADGPAGSGTLMSATLATGVRVTVFTPAYDGGGNSIAGNLTASAQIVSEPPLVPRAALNTADPSDLAGQHTLSAYRSEADRVDEPHRQPNADPLPLSPVPPSAPLLVDTARASAETFECDAITPLPTISVASDDWTIDAGGEIV